jgi:hypothetical protein
MSIDLTPATPSSNTSIQYTYPEMDIRSIQTISSVKKFFFRNGMSSSSFAFTDSENSVFKSGIASEGTISVGIHKDNAYELTIKHISSTGSDYFFVVFPISSDGDESFIDEIVKADDNSDINVINMDVANVSLNTMITGGDIYKYDCVSTNSNNGKTVFVFSKPIKTTSDLAAIKNPHNYWNDGKNFKKILSSDNEKITEEIVCDSTGDAVEEQKKDDSVLIREASKIGYVSLFFILLAGWIAYFYGIPFINNNLMHPDNWKTRNGFLPIIINIVLIIIVFGSVYGSNKKLSMYTKPEAILMFIALIWPLDVVFRSVLYGLLWVINNIYEFNAYLKLPNGFFIFIFGYLNNDVGTEAKNQFATYSLYALFAIWIMTIFAIMIK